MMGRYLELEVSLKGTMADPKVKSFAVSHHCPGVAYWGRP